MIAGAVAAGVFAVALSGPVAAGSAGAQDQVSFTHKGIDLVAVPVKPGTRADTSIPGPRPGLDSLRRGLDVIHLKSPFSVARLETLKNNGQVIIAYNPNFEEGKTGVFALAAFFPDFFKKDASGEGAKRFVVVVGPHAIKWPADELAMVIVHELVGHGMQHLRGRLEYIRELDLECAANLYGEKFYQDIGIDKTDNDVIAFRRALEDHWCSDFKRYLRRREPSLMKLWDVLNPDVPRLLAAFENYADEQRTQGTSAKAIGAAKELQQAEAAKWVRRVEAEGTPEEQFNLGIAYRDGLGVPKDYLQAHYWLSLAAATYPPGKARDAVVKARDSNARRLSPEQLEAVRKKAKAWWDTHRK